MKVFTFHSEIPQLRDPDLLTIWHESWIRHGWEPIILNATDAHNADAEMFSRFRASPLLETRNIRAYSIAAMIRWIAVTRVMEPCIHVDIDVICNGFKPEDVIIHDPVPTFLAGSTCPCAVAASPRGWKLFAAWLECAPFVPRFDAAALAADSSDQYATSIMPTEFYFVQPGCPCKLYLEQEGWRDAPMIHCANRVTPHPRSETIKKLGLA